MKMPSDNVTTLLPMSDCSVDNPTFSKDRALQAPIRRRDAPENKKKCKRKKVSFLQTFNEEYIPESTYYRPSKRVDDQGDETQRPPLDVFWYMPEDYKQFKKEYLFHLKTIPSKRHDCGGRILRQNFQAFCSVSDTGIPEDEETHQEGSLMTSPQVVLSMTEAMKSLQSCLDHESSASAIADTAIGLERMACRQILHDKKRRRARLWNAILELQRELNQEKQKTKCATRVTKGDRKSAPRRPRRRVSDPCSCDSTTPSTATGASFAEDENRHMEAIRQVSASITRPSRLFAHHIAVAGRAA